MNLELRSRLVRIERQLLRAKIRWFHSGELRRMGNCGVRIPSFDQSLTVECKICKGDSKFVGSVDFNKSCEVWLGEMIPACGVRIPYLKCIYCGFLFAVVLDNWSADEFKKFVYNEQYRLIDPDYKTIRPKSNAHRMCRLLKNCEDLSVLDYGGGNGVFASTLQNCRPGQISVTTYDPFTPEYASYPIGQFDLITCFETLEHVPSPSEIVGNMAMLAKSDSAVVFSTLLQSPNSDKERLDWWYIAPRNGHISVFSPDAIRLVWASHGFRVSSANEYMHLAWRGSPKTLSSAIRDAFRIV